MKKNGFISMSIIYSFLILFLMLMLLIVSNLMNRQLILKTMVDEAKEEINAIDLVYNMLECDISHASEYIQITNQKELNDINYNPSGNYMIMNDINITGTFQRISSFSGILCGNNKQ